MKWIDAHANKDRIPMNSPGGSDQVMARFSAGIRQLSPASALLFLTFATWVAAVPIWFVSPPRHREFNVFYMLPAAIPFGMFLLARGRALTRSSRWTLLLDLLVVGISILRVFVALPWLSGHAFFFSYAALTTSRALPRLVAAIALCGTVVYKLAVSPDAAALGGGMLAAACLAGVYHRVSHSVPE